MLVYELTESLHVTAMTTKPSSTISEQLFPHISHIFTKLYAIKVSEKCFLTYRQRERECDSSFKRLH